ncbi:3-deoxy-7-phosphoheptulonate synthase [Nocardia brasiliensis]|uniref:3-deoxy-7-phosphoheptulonate synthase n=1 Tax=Nocardia brasiliensis TaxID=37326 RepID=UPI00245685AA|nr:3-deoxy-7-phosphoheptulonate synthase [Nocardia brasiliensis]
MATVSAVVGTGETGTAIGSTLSHGDALACFAHPLTRMLLASDGFTTPVLEALLGTALRVRVLRQDEMYAVGVPVLVTEALQVSDEDRVVVRRSCLVDPNMMTVSVNYVVATSGPAARGVDSLQVPIGYSLIAQGLSQRRQILRIGAARWPDGRRCAAKAYLMTLVEQPLCYIRECFNPDLIPADPTDDAADLDTDWADEPPTPVHPPVELFTALAPTPRRADHQPVWPDQKAVRAYTARLRTMPPLVSAEECATLTTDIAAATQGRAFVLQLGDCAESLRSCGTRDIISRQALAAAAAALFAYGSGIRVVSIGRLAGQYAKPRSKPIDPATGLPSYFGDMVNAHQCDLAARTPDPQRMLQAYFHAAATLNHLRAHPVPPADVAAALLRTAAGHCPEPAAAQLLRDVSGLLQTTTAAPAQSRELHNSVPPLRTSHEALILPYEHALTRRTADGHWLDHSAHLLWIGERTRDPDGAHIDFAARIRNPIAVKLGPSVTTDQVKTLCRTLGHPETPGRLTLITRLGAVEAGSRLPALFEAAATTGVTVCWVCDPMHANTTTISGHKTRGLGDITAEIRAFLCACRDTGTIPGGLHLETTPTPVTECLGGWQQLTPTDLPRNYRTLCDPRLNPTQTLQCILLALTELHHDEADWTRQPASTPSR